jgi:hypothetical protein
MNNTFLLNVDRYTRQLGLLNSVVAAVVDKFVPSSAAVACSGSVVCETACAPCCCSKSRPYEVRAATEAQCGTGPTSICYTGSCITNCAF